MWFAFIDNSINYFDVGISEGCFIFDFASLPLDVARPIEPIKCTIIIIITNNNNNVDLVLKTPYNIIKTHL